MDGCSRQNPAYRPAKGRAPRGALSIGPEISSGSGTVANDLAISSTGPSMGLVRARLGEKASTDGQGQPGAGWHQRPVRSGRAGGGRLLPALPPAHREEGRRGLAERAAALPALPPARRAPAAPGRRRPPSPGPAAAPPACSRTRPSAPARTTTRPRRTSARRSATVAEEVGSRPERLLMVDYQQRASDDDSLPPLSDVFAAYGSWKRARRAAANRRPSWPPPAGHRARAGIVPPAMEVLIVLVPFVVAGIVVIFIAFCGRPERGARGLPDARAGASSPSPSSCSTSASASPYPPR